MIYLPKNGKEDKAIQEIQDRLHQIGIPAKRTRGIELERFLYWLINPGLKTPQIIDPESIMPKTIEFEKDHMVITSVEGDEKFVTTKYIKDYPFEVGELWLTPLMMIPGVTITITMEKVNREEIKKALSDSVQVKHSTAGDAKRLDEALELERDLYQQYELLDFITSGTEEIKNVTILITTVANTLKRLKEIERSVENVLMQQEMRSFSFYMRQKAGWAATLPKIAPELNDNSIKPIACSTLGLGFPFINSMFKDAAGEMVGFTSTGGLIMIDHREIGGERPNANQVVIGTSGSGKSVLVKKDVIDNIQKGIKTIIFDPENEYGELVEYFSGKEIDISDGEHNRINPLEIFEGEDMRSMDDALKQQRLFVAEFFNLLFPELMEKEWTKAYLDKAVQELYKKFGLDKKELKDLPTINSWPILDDLYRIFKEKGENDMLDRDAQLKWRALKDVFYQVSKQGNMGNLWNGQTTLKLSQHDLIVMNAHKFKGTPQLKGATYYLILKFFEQAIQENKRKNIGVPEQNKHWINLVIDEAHLFIDKKNPIALDFIAEQVKRIRKYNGWVTVITQNIKDFVGNGGEIAKKAEGIINNSTYQMIGKMKPGDLEDLKNLFKNHNGGLTDSELEFLSTAGRGEFLMMIGDKRIQVDVLLTDWEKEAIDNLPHYYFSTE